MARIARVVVPGYPHHVTQRGNRQQKTFFCDDDCRYYLELLSAFSKTYGTEVWGYCLMSNHVHLVMVPIGLTGLDSIDPKEVINELISACLEINRV